MLHWCVSENTFFQHFWLHLQFIQIVTITKNSFSNILTLRSNELIQSLTALKCFILNFHQIWKSNNSKVFISIKSRLSNRSYIFSINKPNLFKNVFKCLIFNRYNIVRKDYSILKNKLSVIISTYALTLKAFLRQFFNQQFVIRFLIQTAQFLNTRRIFKVIFANYKCNFLIKHVFINCD